jgi:biopolymer transport protein TolR
MGAGMAGGGAQGRRRGGRRRTSGFAPMSEINVTPFVDVMLVLLIVFMVAAPLLNVSVPIDLPETKAEQTPGEKEDPITITVDGDGKVYIGDGEVTLDTLASKLTAIAQSRQSESDTKDQRVRVRGDKGVNYGLVMQVIGELNSAGYRRIDLLSNPKN